ncbi:MAG TPA: bacillithiol biosynthesis deacetylase BshB1 [Thermoanaerobaculia bacterium]|nr:bacillithiol biosynthesis deacetylase BshB1 [Thermoanaerobaculia bacterium]
MPIDVLAIAAHPDDVELTCGGTLARLKASGYRFGIVDLTRGEMGTRGTPEIRAVEAKRAAEILGAEFRESLDLGDGGLGRGRQEELAVIDVIRREKPRVVLAPYPDDRHPDHRRAGQLVTDAAYYAGLRKLETAHPAHRPQQTVYFATFDPREPDFVVDVTPFIELRRRAMRAFESQFHDPKSSEPPTILSQRDFLDMVESRARQHGALIGVEFGEGFLSRRPPRVDDLVKAFAGFEPGF